MNSLTKEGPYSREGEHSVNGEGDSYTHVHAGLNTDKGNVSGPYGLRAQNNVTAKISQDSDSLVYLQTSAVYGRYV